MKHRTKLIILFVLLLVLVLIPIGIYASKTLTMHFLSDEEIAEANMKEKERALAEKEAFARTHNMNRSSSETSKMDSSNTDDANIKEKLKKSEEEDKKKKRNN